MPEFDDDRHWQPPARDAKPSDKMAWMNDVVSSGETYNSTLLSSRDIGTAINLISGRPAENLNQSRSNLNMNREKRALREVVANIADIRSVDAYTSDNPAYQSFLTMLNKVWKAVYFESKFPTAFKQATQWLVAVDSPTSRRFTAICVFKPSQRGGSTSTCTRPMTAFPSRCRMTIRCKALTDGRASSSCRSTKAPEVLPLRLRASPSSPQPLLRQRRQGSHHTGTEA